MTEDTQDIQDNIPDELETLKARATLMGVKFHPNIGLNTLKEKLNGILEEQVTITNLASDKKPNEAVPFLTHAEYKKLQEKDSKRKAGSLIRVNVRNMNPAKKEWEGEIISVGSAKIGTFKKFIPFNTTDGWHIPYMMYEAIKERQCSVFQTVKDHLGNKIRKAKQINEFIIEVLSPLTKEELKDLAQRQAMAGSIDN